MSLQGTLDTFALQDVLRLLASTSKTGHLRINGSRGRGGVWFEGGRVVAASADAAGRHATPAEVVFDLLRFDEGSFAFDTGATALDPKEPLEVGPVITEAEGLLEEWKDIEAVVPSLGHRVSLAPELPGPAVTVTREQWGCLRAIGEGRVVGQLGEALSLGELAVSRAVKGLVESGLVVLEDRGDTWPPVEARPSRTTGETPATPKLEAVPDHDDEARRRPPAPERPGPMRRLDPGERPAARGPRPGAGRPPLDRPGGPGRPGREPAASRSGLPPRPDRERAGLGGRPAGERPLAPPADRAVAGADDTEGPDTGPTATVRPGEPAARPAERRPSLVEDPELARQLADLGPVAAAAVVAAADAETAEEREAALEGIQGDDGEPLNRGMLLKFLSSVRT